MAFDQVQCIGQGADLGFENRNPGLTIGEIQTGKIVVALAQAFVDQAKFACCIKDIAVGRKGGGG